MSTQKKANYDIMVAILPMMMMMQMMKGGKGGSGSGGGFFDKGR